MAAVLLFDIPEISGLTPVPSGSDPAVWCPPSCIEAMPFVWPVFTVMLDNLMVESFRGEDAVIVSNFPSAMTMLWMHTRFFFKECSNEGKYRQDQQDQRHYLAKPHVQGWHKTCSWCFALIFMKSVKRIA